VSSVGRSNLGLFTCGSIKKIASKWYKDTLFPILIETLGVSPFSFPRSHSLSLLPRCNCAHLTSATTTQSAHGANSPPFLLIFFEFGVWRVAGETFGVAHPAVDKAPDADKNPERENQKSTGTGCVCN
jgi:hypothetical protein